MNTFLRLTTIACFVLASVNALNEHMPESFGWIATGLLGGFIATWHKEGE